VKIVRTHDHRRATDREIEVYFKHLGLSGATLVVVAVGAELYASCDSEPAVALEVVAWRASEDLARRRQPVDPDLILERGREKLRMEGSLEGVQPNQGTLPREAA
jgi:hypothetical protein